MDSASVIVKPDKVKEQREREAAEQPPEGGEKYPQPTGEGEGSVRDGGGTTVDLDAARMGRDAGQIADEVLSHLSGLVGANVKISLEIDVEIPDGIPENVIRIVKENASTLKFKSQGFEEE